jgi:hypothetical protein
MTTILFFTLLAFAISAFVVAPIFRSYVRRGYSNNSSSNNPANDLIERKETIYSHIKDIEFDYEMGKLSKEDFLKLRQQYKDEAVSLLKEIDKVRGEPLQAKKTLSQQKKTTTFCWMCGTALSPDDRFCANCGNEIT